MAVKGMTVTLDPPTVLATVTEVGPASQLVEDVGSGQGVAFDGYEFILSNITNPPATIPDPGPYSVTLEATAENVDDGAGVAVCRVDDESTTVTATPKVPGNPPTDSPVQVKLIVTAAGQVPTTAS